jgi:hypothetical protein
MELLAMRQRDFVSLNAMAVIMAIQTQVFVLHHAVGDKSKIVSPLCVWVIAQLDIFIIH